MTTERHMEAVEKGDSDESAPAVLERLIHKAEQAEASDIHLQMGAVSAAVSFRLDGVMTPAAELTVELAERVFGRIKFLARLKTYQESLPQDGRIDKAAVRGCSDIRVATYPTVTGEKIVLRLFSSAHDPNACGAGISQGCPFGIGAPVEPGHGSAVADRPCRQRQNHHDICLSSTSRRARGPAHNNR